MDIKKLSDPLNAEDVDFRVKTISVKGWALLLAYKSARIDQQRLDEVVGPLNWQREHLNNNANCRVSIWDDARNHWVSKEDTGTESNTEKEKGLASDSFKRACFNWGIGRELYNYPKILIQLKDNEYYLQDQGAKKIARASYDLKLDQWKWASQFYGSNLTFLGAKDEKGITRFKFGDYFKDA